MRIRATPSAGSSTRSLPDASPRLLKHHQRVALRDRLALLAALAEAFPGAAVVVADDGSRDGTADVAQAAGAELIRTGRRIGKGGAATLAVERLLAGGVERAVVLCDGDLGASARELSKLVD